MLRSLLSGFIRDFVDQNPLSKVSIVVTYKEGARLLSDFLDSFSDHCEKLQKFAEFEGNPSLQNSLELALDNFQCVPSYGSKEVLCLFSSLTNCDPGDIFKTLEKVQ